jgi:O-antigen/teichoic acid export membrane protein
MKYILRRFGKNRSDLIETNAVHLQGQFHLDLAQKVIQTYIFQLLSILLGMITSVIVARALGPVGKGTYAVAYTLGTLGVQFGNLGLHAANVYYGARDRDWLASLMGNSLLVSFGLGSVISTFLWFFFRLNPHLAPINGLPLLIALLWAPFGLAYILMRNLLLGIQDIQAFNNIDLGNRLFVLIFTVLIVLTKNANVEVVYLIALTGLILGCIGTYWRLHHQIGGVPTLSLSIFTKQSTYGFKIYISSISNEILMRGDIFIVNYFLNTDQVGYYAVASAMVNMVYTFSPVVGSILYSKLSPMDNCDEKWRINKTIVMRVGVIMLVIVILSVLFAKLFLVIIYGDTYLPALWPFLWLLPGIFFLSLGMTTGVIFAASGMPFYAIFPFLISGGMNVILNIYIVPRFGIIGASIVSDVTYFLFFIMMVCLVPYFLKKNRSQVT